MTSTIDYARDAGLDYGTAYDVGADRPSARRFVNDICAGSRRMRRLGNVGADRSSGGNGGTIANAPAALLPSSPSRPGPLHAGHCRRPWRPQ